MNSETDWSATAITSKEEKWKDGLYIKLAVMATRFSEQELRVPNAQQIEGWV
jgi:hypothetical protein